ncbi:MAG: hypothetical protein H0U92_12265 [Actinobacteria bacterium]|nr:hypothetical protein [Actinomycetota bacterium]
MALGCEIGGQDEAMEQAGQPDASDERLWTWIHLASLAVVLAVPVYLSRGQWFFGDERDFILVASPEGNVALGTNEICGLRWAGA